MSNLKENTITILLILLGVIIVPVLFIWSADNLLALTLKTFVAAFFLLLLIRAVPRRRGEATDAKTQRNDQES
jgi:multisubunit Na+/H+ antiporter MnhG subunit